MTNNQLSTQQAKRDIAIDTSVWTPQDIKRFFDPENLLTDKQVGQALSLIKGRNLNPLANEVYIVAYRKKSGGTEFSLIVSKEAFLKRAAQSPNYEGFEAGVVAVDEDGVMHERKGALLLPGDTLVGGWARVYRKNFKVPVEIFVSREEYDKKQSTWNAMPATMIRKTALVNALREAFPEDLGNMYTEDDGGETFDRIKDVTPTETREEVMARKMAQIEQMKQEQTRKQAEPVDTSYPADEVPDYIEEQGELFDEELEY
ncbi:phage recombination protein Bet [Streptococcus equi subsp. zooepidemicus]|uniref:phage recombination protein Bet n=1 Tax=Streptococcus equi TaxID=1336 RepID=UPI001E2E07C4|nr:phage recombination protein Bet [Streptococcus equi]MCD3414382.1 phage recombination protein Bet [Streptococcus equi subsp. zooepidemicus]HEL0787327.1 phage recombination protein Bet [Streptococcus equi subsp. zooepidemicus]